MSCSPSTSGGGSETSSTQTLRTERLPTNQQLRKLQVCMDLLDSRLTASLCRYTSTSVLLSGFSKHSLTESCRSWNHPSKDCLPSGREAGRHWCPRASPGPGNQRERSPLRTWIRPLSLSPLFRWIRSLVWAMASRRRLQSTDRASITCGLATLETSPTSFSTASACSS